MTNMILACAFEDGNHASCMVSPAGENSETERSQRNGILEDGTCALEKYGGVVIENLFLHQQNKKECRKRIAENERMEKGDFSCE